MYHDLSSTASWYSGHQEKNLEALSARDNSTSIRNGQTLVCREACGAPQGQTGTISPQAVAVKFLAETFLLESSLFAYPPSSLRPVPRWITTAPHSSSSSSFLFSLLLSQA